MFKILICTEALTMGAVFRNMKLVIKFLTPDSARTQRRCNTGPLVAGSGESQRGVDNGAAAIENREREAEAGVAPGAYVENAGDAGDLGADEILDNVDKDVAANVADADVDERWRESIGRGRSRDRE
ncbi:hypothetical protein FRC12_007651 [Ceratobasidium sp. 428]|nr:hypothetical protein FRC12_007651 [Ceratobasidium sp. 428]